MTRKIIKGMTNFKADTFKKIDHYLRIQEEKKLYIRISFFADRIFPEDRNRK